MRSISRICDVSINTVTKLLEDAGRFCLAFHDERVRGLTCKRIQADEIWSFNYCKPENLPTTKSAPRLGRGLDMDEPLRRQQADLQLAGRWARCELGRSVHARSCGSPGEPRAAIY